MDTFSYLSVMISMVLGLGITQLFAGVGSLIQIRQRVKPDELHTLWMILVILGHVHLWWSLWGLRNTVTWTYPQFIYVLIGPSALVLSSHIIMPGEFYEEVHKGKFDLRSHYEHSNRIFFMVFLVVMVWAVGLEWVLGARRSIFGLQAIKLTGMLAIAACVLSRMRMVHRIAAIVLLATWAIDLVYLRFRLGTFDFHP